MTQQQLQKQISEFIELLEQSSLSDERKDYWFSRLQEGTFDEKAEQDLMDELQTQLANLDYAIQVTKAELAQEETELAKAEQEALPYLQQAAAALPAALEEDMKNCKKEVAQAKDEMIRELKVAREGGREKDIEALRKKLLGGK